MKTYNPKTNYNVLVIPTGETSFRNRDILLDKMTEDQKRDVLQDKFFPVSSKAAELFNNGNGGIEKIFITGGHYGFAYKGRFWASSEAKETREYLEIIKGIDRKKYLIDDNRSLDTLGNFAIPLAYPDGSNPNLGDFKNMLIICQEGHQKRIEDCVNLVMPSDINVDYFTVPGNHNNSIITKKYHEIYMGLLHKRYGEKANAKVVADFLKKEHPFYKIDWFDMPVWKRKVIMSKKVFGDWNREVKG